MLKPATATEDVEKLDLCSSIVEEGAKPADVGSQDTMSMSSMCSSLFSVWKKP